MGYQHDLHLDKWRSLKIFVIPVSLSLRQSPISVRQRKIEVRGEDSTKVLGFSHCWLEGQWVLGSLCGGGTLSFFALSPTTYLILPLMICPSGS